MSDLSSLSQEAYEFLRKRKKPSEFTVYTHSDTGITYLKNFKKSKPNYCPSHGLHDSWSLTKDKKFGKYRYSILRCKPCGTVCSTFWHLKHPFRSFVRSIRVREKRKEIKTTIEPIQIFNICKRQQMRCALTGMRFDKFENRPSIDRIGAAGSYTSENIQLTNYLINKMKNKFEEKKFLDYCYLIYDFRIVKKGNYGFPIFNIKTGGIFRDRNYVQKRINLFRKNGQLKCEIHGEHPNWKITPNKLGNEQLSCRTCINERQNKRREERKGENFKNIFQKTETRMKDFLSSGQATCEAHGSHSEFQIRENNVRCKRCHKEQADQYYFKKLLTNIKYQTKTNRRTSDLKMSLEEIEGIYQHQNGRCYFSGLPLEVGKLGSVSVDRLDNDLDYEVSNCCISFGHFNKMKSDIPLQIFLAYIEKVHVHSSNKYAG
jgi:hypothetical protein